MNTKQQKKETKKFELERFEVAKLKNLIVIKGGSEDDPVDTNNTKGGSSRGCSGG